MMFDFQTLRYASPMIDLAVFMANSTGTDVRSTHFSFIFKTYHEEVIKTMMLTLKKFRPEIPDIYRWDWETCRIEKIEFWLIFRPKIEKILKISNFSTATIISSVNTLDYRFTATSSPHNSCKFCTIPMTHSTLRTSMRRRSVLASISSFR